MRHTHTSCAHLLLLPGTKGATAACSLVGSDEVFFPEPGGPIAGSITIPIIIVCHGGPFGASMPSLPGTNGAAFTTASADIVGDSGLLSPPAGTPPGTKVEARAEMRPFGASDDIGTWERSCDLRGMIR